MSGPPWRSLLILYLFTALGTAAFHTSPADQKIARPVVVLASLVFLLFGELVVYRDGLRGLVSSVRGARRRNVLPVSMSDGAAAAAASCDGQSLEFYATKNSTLDLQGAAWAWYAWVLYAVIFAASGGVTSVDFMALSYQGYVQSGVAVILMLFTYHQYVTTQPKVITAIFFLNTVLLLIPHEDAVIQEMPLSLALIKAAAFCTVYFMTNAQQLLENKYDRDPESTRRRKEMWAGSVFLSRSQYHHYFLVRLLRSSWILLSDRVVFGIGIAAQVVILSISIFILYGSASHAPGNQDAAPQSSTPGSRVRRHRDRHAARQRTGGDVYIGHTGGDESGGGDDDDDAGGGGADDATDGLDADDGMDTRIRRRGRRPARTAAVAEPTAPATPQDVRDPFDVYTEERPPAPPPEEKRERSLLPGVTIDALLRDPPTADPSVSVESGKRPQPPPPPPPSRSKARSSGRPDGEKRRRGSRRSSAAAAADPDPPGGVGDDAEAADQELAMAAKQFMEEMGGGGGESSVSSADNGDDGILFDMTDDFS